MEKAINALIQGLLDGIRACTATSTKYVPVEVESAKEIVEILKRMDDDGK